MEKIYRRLTYANVTSSLAIFLVLCGGAAFAASQLAKNSVGSKQLRKNAVTAAKIKKNAINSAKVKNGSLRVADFKAGQLPQGEQGPQGIPGATGIPGPTASSFSQNHTSVTLEGAPKEVNRATITTTTQSRIIAQASVDLNATAAGDLFCFITEDKGNLLNEADDWTIRANTAANENANMNLVGSKVLPPGTYTLRVACGRNTGTASYVESDLALIAAAA